MSNPAESVRVIESFGDSGARVDREAGVIYGVKLIGLESKNGRSYPGPVLQKAASLYEGLHVNLNHPSRPDDPRSFDERWGKVVNARHVEGQGNFGDIKYNPKHAATESILWYAENDPAALGFSHNATLRFKPGVGGTGKRTVEAIVGVRSLDLVADPATTNGFFESIDPATEPETAMDLKSLTLEQIQAERPDLLKSITEQLAAGDAAKAQAQELESLKAKLATLEAERAQLALEATIASELEVAELTKEQCSDVFMEQLKTAKDEAARAALIADRKSLVGNATEGKQPAKPEQKPVTTKATEGKAPSLDSLEDVRKFITSRA